MDLIKNHIIDLINNKIEELNNEVFPLENQYQYFLSFDKLINEDKTFNNMDDFQILEFLIMIDSKEEFNKTLSDVSDICDILKDKNIDGKLLIMSIDIINVSKRIKVLDYIINGNLSKLKEFWNNNSSNIKENLNVLSFSDFKKCMKELILQYNEIFESSSKIAKFISLVTLYDGNLAKDFSRITLWQKYDLSKIKEKKYKNFFGVVNDREYGAKEILKYIDIKPILSKLQEKIYNLEKIRNTYCRDKLKEISTYKKMINVLEELDGYVTLDENYKNASNDIYNEFIMFILKHNASHFKSLKDENDKINKSYEIEMIFSKYNMPLDALHPNLKNLILENVKYDELNALLSCLALSEYDWFNVNNKNFAQVILNTNIEALKYVAACINSGLISKKFAFLNIGIIIFNDTYKTSNDVEPLFNTFKSDLELLKNISNIDRKISKNESLLIYDTKDLKQSYELAKRYGINFNSENTNLHILNHCENFDDLDSFIELGFIDYIKNNSQLLRSDSKNIITRLSIMCNIGINVITNQNRLLSSITSGKNFYVSNDCLNEYSFIKVEDYIQNENFEILKENERLTISKQTENLDIVKYLDELFKISEYEYQINDNIISRIKFLRNLECLANLKEIDNDVIIASITYHSILDNETIEFIKNSLGKQFCKSI